MGSCAKSCREEMSSMKKSTAEWIEKAEADWRVADRLARVSDPLHDIVCFHCQQCAEKYLKALLEELGLTIPHTHNLVALLPLLVTHHPSLSSFRRSLDYLTRYAVATRYPGKTAPKRQASPALQ